MTMTPIDATAPRDVRLLPDYWDARRVREGKRDLSRCAAELRRALAAPESGT